VIGFSGKWLMYEESLRVPLIILDPSSPRSQVSGEMALNIDLAPTILELAGKPVPAGMQGKSLVAVLRDPQQPLRDDFFYEHLYRHKAEPIAPSEGVRSRDWEYIVYVDQEGSDREEMYNLRSDPFEMKNLAGVAQHRGQLETMRRQHECRGRQPRRGQCTAASRKRCAGSTNGVNLSEPTCPVGPVARARSRSRLGWRKTLRQPLEKPSMLNSLAAVNRHKSPVYTVAIAPDGSRYLWAGGSPRSDCPVVVCEAVSKRVLFTLKRHTDPVVRARFLRNGSIVSLSFDSHLCYWTADGKLAGSNELHLGPRADGLAVSVDGTFAVIGDSSGQISGWRLPDCAKLFTFKENSRDLDVSGVALHPSGKRLLSGGAECKVRAWELASQRKELEIDLAWGQRIQAVAWSPQGETFAAAIAPDGAAKEGSKSLLMIFESTSKVLASLYPDGDQPFCCGFSPDGRLVAAAGGGDDDDRPQSEANCAIHIWNVASRGKVAKLSGHSAMVRDLAFSPDSSWLLSAGWDKTARLWHLSSKTP
jgi:hypothetical protein